MTPEEMERTMQFILAQQAQFAADIQKVTEGQARLTETTLANTGMIGTIIRTLEKITENQANLTEAQTQTNIKVGELAERLDTFIVVVEKFITEGRNGKSRG